MVEAAGTSNYDLRTWNLLGWISAELKSLTAGSGGGERLEAPEECSSLLQPGVPTKAAVGSPRMCCLKVLGSATRTLEVWSLPTEAVRIRGGGALVE